MESKSNWHVIMGGPSSGKKSVIKHLKALGFPVINEVARGVIKKKIRQGKTPEEIKEERRRDEEGFQLSLLPIKAKLEARIPKEKTIFWNRAMPDSIAYLRNCGGDPEEALALCERNLYRKVFLFEQLSEFTPDYARTETPDEAQQISQLLREAYEQLGYEVISVPEMSPIPQLSIAKRLEFILTQVYEGGD